MSGRDERGLGRNIDMGSSSIAATSSGGSDLTWLGQRADRRAPLEPMRYRPDDDKLTVHSRSAGGSGRDFPFFRSLTRTTRFCMIS